MSGGRKTKLTPEVQEKIAALLMRGNFIETAAAAAGVTATSVRTWLRRGNAERLRTESGDPREGERVYADFAAAVEYAQAIGEARHVKIIDDAAQAGTYRASTWMLERMYPERWGKREVIDVEVDLGTLRRNLLSALGVTDGS